MDVVDVVPTPGATTDDEDEEDRRLDEDDDDDGENKASLAKRVPVPSEGEQDDEGSREQRYLNQHRLHQERENVHWRRLVRLALVCYQRPSKKEGAANPALFTVDPPSAVIGGRRRPRRHRARSKLGAALAGPAASCGESPGTAHARSQRADVHPPAHQQAHAGHRVAHVA